MGRGMRSREDLFPGTNKVELFLRDLAVKGRVGGSVPHLRGSFACPHCELCCLGSV